MTKYSLILVLSIGALFPQQKMAEAGVEVECNCRLLETAMPEFCDIFTMAVKQDWPSGEKGWRISFKKSPDKKRKENEFVMVLTHKGAFGTSTYRLNFMVRNDTNSVQFSETMVKEAVVAVGEYRQIVESLRTLKLIFTPPVSKKK